MLKTFDESKAPDIDDISGIFQYGVSWQTQQFYIKF